MPIWGRLLNAVVSFGVYPLNEVCPTGLAPQCVLRWPRLPRLMVPGLVVAAALLWGLWRGMQPEAERLRTMFVRGESPSLADDDGWWRKWALAGAAWYTVSIVPFLGISAFGYHALADRFTYIPAVGLSLAALGLWGIGTARRDGKRREPSFTRKRVVFYLTSAALVFLLGALAWRQTGIWRDDKTMWEQTIKVDGAENGVAAAGLGLWHYEFDHGSAASVEWFDRAFAADPDCVQKTGFIYIGDLAERGELKKAAERLKWSATWSLAVRDQERRVRGLDASVELKPLMQHRLARVAYLIHNPELRRAGEEDLKELEELRPNDIHVLYLKGRLALLKGDVARAENAWQRLQAAARPKDCVKYRFFGDLVAAARQKAEDGR